jgi:RHS repeat-associated protein
MERVHMLGSASALQTTVDLPMADRLALRARTVVPWRAVVVAALLSLLVGGMLAQVLAGHRSSSLPSFGRSSSVARKGLSSLPLVAQGVISGTLGADSSAYRVSASGGGFRAASPGQHMRMRFDRSGVLVSSGKVRLGLSLHAVGYGVSLTALGAVAPRVRANRVVYGRAGVSEWYSNGPLGLEQGFTIPRAPSGNPAGPLTLSMALSGDARASLASGGQSVTLSHMGGPALRYTGLSAKDAGGRALHSWLALSAGRILLRVDVHGARYPLRIDPLVKPAKLTGGEEVGKGEFGYSVALSSDGNTALVAGRFDNPILGASNGAVWVFTRSGSTWTQQGPKLTGNGEERNRYFGQSVALSGDGNTAVVGGPGEGENVGAVWVFTRSEGKWTQQGARLTGGEETGKGYFGVSVAVSSDGNTALVGGHKDNEELGVGLGAAWVFTRSEGKWTQQGTKLTGGEESGHGAFGHSVALSSEGNTALIGGSQDNTSVGAAWVFTRSEGKWTQQGTKLTGSGESGKAFFGWSAALSGDGNTALIGGSGDSEEAGAAWVFTRSEGKWTQEGSKLKGGEESGKAGFGYSAALSGDGKTALIGGPEDGASETGAAWVFTRSGSTWLQEGPKLTHGGEKNRFGNGVTLSSEGNTALVGGPNHEKQAGAAWVFTPSGVALEEEYGTENESTPHKPKCLLGYPVNCVTGNQVETQTDLAVGGRVPGLSWTRTYNSQLAATQSEHGPFGWGWTGSYTAHIVFGTVGEEKTPTANVYLDNGSSTPFEKPGAQWAPTAPLVQATLAAEGSNYVYTLPNQSKLTFDEKGRLLSETDRNGNTLTTTLSAEGRLESVSDSAGRKLTLAYNGEGQLESVKDPMGHTVKYTYEAGNLATVTQPGEASLRWQFKYDASHQMTSETDGRSHAIATEYDTSHRVIAQKDAMERVRKWEYIGTVGKENTESVVTEPNGSVTRESFNVAGMPTSITHASGTALAATTTYEYDGNYNQIAVTDPNKHTTKYGYNSAGDRTSTTDANGNETKWTYNSTHDLETTTTPKGEKTTIKRDTHGNPEVIERPAPASKTQKTTYKYDLKGDVTEETDPLEHKKKYEYDAAGDRESETDPEGNKRTWKYNEDSQEIEETSPRKFTTKTERDAQGRPLTVTDPLGHTTKYTYDSDGNRETLTDGNSHKTTYTYDADNEQTKIEKPNGQIIETGYDSAGQVTSQTDGNKNTTKYERNLLEQIIEEVDPLSRKTTKEYDLAGNLKKVTDPATRTTTYTYDSGNRLTEVSYSSGKPATVKYEYDKDGDRTKMTDGTGTNKYTFDQLDRLTETENGHKEKAKYEYDLGNEQTKITYPNTKAVTRAYDKDGRLEKVTDWSSHVTKFSYDPDSDPAATTFPTETKNEDKYAYDEVDQLGEVKMTKAAETLASLVYTRDNDGQVKTVTSKGLPGEEKPANEYDSNNRLTKGATIGYEYDAADNPTKMGTGAYTYDKASELETGPSLKYTYNEMGQRTKTTPTTGAVTTYGYDQTGSLTSVERPKEGEKAEIKDTYAYDGNNLRASQTISGTTTFLAWDVSQALPRLLSDGTNSYIYGPAGHPVEQVSSGGTVTYLHHDQQGSTRLLTGSTGTVTGSTTFDAYGNKTGSTGSSTTPLGYDGQYTSTDTGLIYLRARVYDPTTAQFLTRDPLQALTRAPYSYARDNPVNGADPTGLESSCETPAERRELEREAKAETKEEEAEERASISERVRIARERHLKALKELVAEENANERHEEGESEGEQRKHVIERCVAGIAVSGVEGRIAGKAADTPLGRLANCAAGVYQPIITSGIESLLE